MKYLYRLLTCIIFFVTLPPDAYAEAFIYKQWSTYCDENKCSIIPRANADFALTRQKGSNVWHVVDFVSKDELKTSVFEVDDSLIVLSTTLMPMPEQFKNGNWFYLDDKNQNHFKQGYSLDGIAAAFNFADEKQAIAPDRQAEWQIFNPDWEAYRASIEARLEEDCQKPKDYESEIGNIVFKKFETRPDLRLFAVQCLGGAYNASAYLTILDSYGHSLPFVKGGHGVNEAERRAFVYVDAIQKAQRIEEYVKFRGLGDCFGYTRWEFDGENYQATKTLIDEECDKIYNPVLVE